jgi:hypothetical protein
MHFPLPNHPFAMSGAEAIECADLPAQGKKGGEMLAALYKDQGSIGKKPWTAFALEIQVSDTSAFANCMQAPPKARINAGWSWVDRWKFNATPTILVNGWRITPPPDSTQLKKAILAIMKNGAPE